MRRTNTHDTHTHITLYLLIFCLLNICVLNKCVYNYAGDSTFFNLYRIYIRRTRFNTQWIFDNIVMAINCLYLFLFIVCDRVWNELIWRNAKLYLYLYAEVHHFQSNKNLYECCSHVWNSDHTPRGALSSYCRVACR